MLCFTFFHLYSFIYSSFIYNHLSFNCFIIPCDHIIIYNNHYSHLYIHLIDSLIDLPVTFRIDFKVLLLIYKSHNGLGPKYIADMLTEYKHNRPLRSLGSSQLEIPRVHTKQGESAFSYYAARSWTQLPEEIRCAKTLATFKSRLKTHLFSCAFVE